MPVNFRKTITPMNMTAPLNSAKPQGPAQFPWLASSRGSSLPINAERASRIIR